MRTLLLSLFLGAACDGVMTGEVSYELTCDTVVCHSPQLEDMSNDFKSCGWCVDKFHAEWVVFRKEGACWMLDRRFEASEVSTCY